MTTDLTLAEEFKPTRTMKLAKARLQRALADRAELLDPTQLTKAEFAQWTGSRQAEKWLADPATVAWFLDRDTLRDQVTAEQEQALSVLVGLMRDPDVPPKDRIKAATEVLNLGGAYPSRTRQVIYADAAVGKLSPDELDRELEATKKALIAGPTAPHIEKGIDK